MEPAKVYDFTPQNKTSTGENFGKRKAKIPHRPGMMFRIFCLIFTGAFEKCQAEELAEDVEDLARQWAYDRLKRWSLPGFDLKREAYLERIKHYKMELNGGNERSAAILIGYIRARIRANDLEPRKAYRIALWLRMIYNV